MGDVLCAHRDGMKKTEPIAGREKSGIHISAERETVGTGKDAENPDGGLLWWNW